MPSSWRNTLSSPSAHLPLRPSVRKEPGTLSDPLKMTPACFLYWLNMFSATPQFHFPTKILNTSITYHYSEQRRRFAGTIVCPPFYAKIPIFENTVDSVFGGWSRSAGWTSKCSSGAFQRTHVFSSGKWRADFSVQSWESISQVKINWKRTIELWVVPA